MARKTRLHIQGGVYHVTLRGNGGQPLFFADADHCRLYLLLQEGSARFGYRIHAFCFMPNFIHLALQVDTVPLSKLVQNLAFRYTRWINRQLLRDGHLFQGRYKAVLIDEESYLAELVCYLHLCPVRAGLVTSPDAYPWSSHRAYLGEEALPWLTTECLLRRWGWNPKLARQHYNRFILAGIASNHDLQQHNCGRDSRIVGSHGFVDRILGADLPVPTPPPLDTVVHEVCQAYRLSETQLASPGSIRVTAQARALTGLIVMQTGSGTLTAVAQRFHRDVATLSTGIRRLTTKIRTVGSHCTPWGQLLERFNVKI